MSDRPVIEKIAVVLFSRIDKLAKRYDVTTDLAEAERPTKRQGYTHEDKKIELIEGGEDEINIGPGNPPLLEKVQIFNIKLNAQPSEKDTTPIGKLMNNMISDVIKAVSTPQASWHNMNDLAVNSTWGQPEKQEPVASGLSVILPLMVRYRTDENNPYSVRA